MYSKMPLISLTLTESTRNGVGGRDALCGGGRGGSAEQVLPALKQMNEYLKFMRADDAQVEQSPAIIYLPTTTY